MYRICDLYCDTITQAKKEGQSLAKNSLHVDLEKLKEGNYLLQCFGLHVVLKEEHPFRLCNETIDFFAQQVAQNSVVIKQVTCNSEIDTTKINAVLALSEAGALEGDLDKLVKFYRRGVRIVTLVGMAPNGLAFPNFVLKEKWSDNDFITPNTTQGLTDFGIDVVNKMQELRMIIDVANLSDAGFWEVVKLVKGPFIASHSNSRVEHNVSHNLTDAMIIAIADAEGVIGVSYNPDYVSNSRDNQIQDIVHQIQHIVAVGGVETCALGSGFDDTATPKGISDASQTKVLYEALKEAGFSENDISKIFYKNFLGVFKEVCG